MTDDELASFLSSIVSCCSYAGYHGNNIHPEGDCFCDGLNCPLTQASNFQKQIEKERDHLFDGYEVFCSKDAIRMYLNSDAEEIQKQ